MNAVRALWLALASAAFAALALCGPVFSGAALAQDRDAAPQARYGDDNIAAELVADGMPQAGREWMLALRFTPSSEEWHGYWSNPGDAGQGMQLKLDLPEGWEAGEPLYPVPETLVQELPGSSIMNHIYKGAYAVLIPVRVPDDAVISGLPQVAGHVEFLACTDKICVPQDAVLSAGQGGDFARWRAQAAPMLDARGTFEITGGMLRLAVPLPESVTLANPHLFIAQMGLIEYAAPQSFRRDGDRLVIEMPLNQ